MGEPKVVLVPFVSRRSLCAIGSPCSGPAGSPRALASSAARASRIARSGSNVTIALTRGLSCSMRAMCAAITSRADSAPDRMAVLSSTADHCQIDKAVERSRHAPTLERNAGEIEAHLDAAERRHEHQIVEVAEVADAEGKALQLSQAGSERHVEAFENC